LKHERPRAEENPHSAARFSLDSKRSRFCCANFFDISSLPHSCLNPEPIQRHSAQHDNKTCGHDEWVFCGVPLEKDFLACSPDQYVKIAHTIHLKPMGNNNQPTIKTLGLYWICK